MTPLLIVTKICSKCATEKALTEFYKRPEAVGGFRHTCKSCMDLVNRQWQARNPGRTRELGVKASRAFRKRHPDRVVEDGKRVKAQRRKSGKTSQYLRNRRKTDLNFKLLENLRARFRKSLNGSKKTNRTISLLGCSVEHLKAWLEFWMKPGMTWENYGFYGWHIDHKKPCASFDMTDPEQQKQCFHYTNLQPLWAKENLSKGDKVNGIRG